MNNCLIWDAMEFKDFQKKRQSLLNCKLQENESAFLHNGKLVVEKASDFRQPNHNIEVDKVENQPVYKPNNGNAQGVYLSHFKTVYLTKHTRQEEKIPVPDIKEYRETPSHVLAELMTHINSKVTLGEFFDEVLMNILKRSEYENEIRKSKRKGKLK